MAVLELTTFRLRGGDDTDEASFVDVDASAETGFYCLQQGMLRRTTTRGESGEWGVFVLWATAEHADAAAEAGRSSTELQAFYDRIDTATVEVRRFSTLD